MMNIVFATGNQNKVQEVRQLLPTSITIQSLKEFGILEDIPETQPTIEGNAKQKADFIYEKYHVNVFSEDTGLEIEALNGEPGVRSARYAGEQKDNDANMDLVLEKLAHHENRKARFKTVIALYIDQQYYEFEGIMNGTIHTKKVGKNGFGYDPIFIPEGYNKTIAELSQDQKGKISHRGKAVRKLVEFLSNHS